MHVVPRTLTPRANDARRLSPYDDSRLMTGD
jgi:hypothetical protein